MKFSLYPRTDNYAWSLCLVVTGVASTLSMAALDGLVNPDSVWSSFFGMFFCLVYGIECARQAYALKRTWPQKSIMLLWPFSLISMVNSPTIAIGIGIAAFNILLWFIAYKLAKRLVAISPYQKSDTSGND